MGLSGLDWYMAGGDSGADEVMIVKLIWVDVCFERYMLR